MTETEAREALSRPLVFGNDLQIRAIRFLNELSEAIETITSSPICEECNGRGEVEESCEECTPEEECGGCNEGRVVAECIACSGLGYFVTDWPAVKNEIMRAAITRVKADHRVL